MNVWVLLGAVLAGAALAAVHMGLLRRAVERSVARGRPGWLLLAAPLRAALVAGGLAALALQGGLAVAGGLIGYTLTAQALRRRAQAGLAGGGA